MAHKHAPELDLRHLEGEFCTSPPERSLKLQQIKNNNKNCYSKKFRNLSVCLHYISMIKKHETINKTTTGVPHKCYEKSAELYNFLNDKDVKRK